jgi:hypothetical protein
MAAVIRVYSINEDETLGATVSSVYYIKTLLSGTVRNIIFNILDW